MHAFQPNSEVGLVNLLAMNFAETFTGEKTLDMICLIHLCEQVLENLVHCGIMTFALFNRKYLLLSPV